MDSSNLAAAISFFVGWNAFLNVLNLLSFLVFFLPLCVIKVSQSDHIFNKENFTCIHIFPFPKSSLAPVTNQCPGLSCGPRQCCDVSTNLSSFWVWTGTGGPVGKTLESMLTVASAFFSLLLSGLWFPPPSEVLMTENSPNFWDVPNSPRSQFDCNRKQPDTRENRSRRWRTFFELCFFTCSWAPITMLAVLASLGLSHSTGAMQMWENLFPCTPSKYWSPETSSDPRHTGVGSTLFSSIFGGWDICWRWIPNLQIPLHLYQYQYSLIMENAVRSH